MMQRWRMMVVSGSSAASAIAIAACVPCTCPTPESVDAGPVDAAVVADDAVVVCRARMGGGVSPLPEESSGRPVFPRCRTETLNCIGSAEGPSDFDRCLADDGTAALVVDDEPIDCAECLARQEISCISERCPAEVVDVLCCEETGRTDCATRGPLAEALESCSSRYAAEIADCVDTRVLRCFGIMR